MTVRDVKIIKGCRRAKNHVTTLTGKIKLYEAGLSGKSYLDGVKVTSSPKSYDDKLVNLMIMKEQLNQATEEYLDLQFKALDIFDQFSDMKERACLTDYYLCGLPVDEVAELNGYCIRTVYRKLGSGIDNIRSLPPREAEEMEGEEKTERVKKFDSADSFLGAMNELTLKFKDVSI
ncbi:DUF1492 domain-containing protein [Aerococcus sp. UMB1112A]|uniref:DUF1492 domain-containing protein n=1 Tax=Aerococcus sp. UMB1112A TaxID=3050609 RepID=UPI0025509678|nr:DUF1492 domain-containing protein [Aerococcus sp. UMB1112A]MDK8502101.1 DUF1492 domain-containing protein [Aerococcus sp. UMB1112A]